MHVTLRAITLLMVLQVNRAYYNGAVLFPNDRLPI